MTHILGNKIKHGLMVTGQTTQYDGKKDDGYYQKGIALSFTKNTTGQYSGTTDITVNGKTHALSNNTVTDNVNGLMWTASAPDADIGPDNDGKLYWLDDVNDEDIFDYCDAANAANLAGHNDWQVPNVKELISIINFSLDNPCWDSTYFNDVAIGNYWSSSTIYTTYGKFANFQTGVIETKAKITHKLYCRLVRGGNY